MQRILTFLLLTSCAINAMDANNQLPVQYFDVELFHNHAGSSHKARTLFIRNGLGKHVVLEGSTVTDQEEAHPQPGYENPQLRKKYSYDDVKVTIDKVNETGARVRYTHTYDAWKNTWIINWVSWLWSSTRTETVTLALGKPHENIFCPGETPDRFGSKLEIRSGRGMVLRSDIQNPAALAPLKCAITVAYHFKRTRDGKSPIEKRAIPFHPFELLSAPEQITIERIEHSRYALYATLLGRANDSATISCTVEDKTKKDEHTREVTVPLHNNFNAVSNKFLLTDDTNKPLELHIRTFQDGANNE